MSNLNAQFQATQGINTENTFPLVDFDRVPEQPPKIADKSYLLHTDLVNIGDTLTDPVDSLFLIERHIPLKENIISARH
jgi:hypothetical protein